MHGAAARARAAATISQRGLGNGIRRRWETSVTLSQGRGRCDAAGAQIEGLKWRIARRVGCYCAPMGHVLGMHRPDQPRSPVGVLHCNSWSIHDWNCRSNAYISRYTARLGIVQPRCSSLNPIKHHQMPPKNRTEVPLNTFLSNPGPAEQHSSREAYNWIITPVVFE